MKKVVMTLVVLILVVVMIGADIRRENSAAAPSSKTKKHCYGYTIIEFGKGINCDGDTVKLVKVNGGQQQIKEPA